MKNEFDKMNDSARSWARDTRKQLRSALIGVQARQTGDLQKSVRYTTGRSFGVIEWLAFKFNPSGIFVEKGVGKGWPIGGKTAMNSVKARIAKPWYNPVIDRNIGKLADDLANDSANLADENFKIN